jgi:oligopeptide transport system substrate-binding protein
MPSWTKRILLATATALSLALVACGGGSSEPQTASNNAAPQDQQVLRMRINGEPKTIDPGLVNFASEVSLTRQLFAGLFTYDDSLKVVPQLAAAVPTVDNGGLSKDGLTVSVKLKDARWSDGKAVTAGDFVYGMQRVLDPKTAAPFASTYYSLLGAREYNTALGTKDAPKTPTDAQLSELKNAVGVKAQDDKTVVYTLRTADPSFLNRLASPAAYGVRQDIVAKFGDKWTEAGNLVGNGPFMLGEWAHEQRLVLVPNQNYYGDKAKLQRIVVNVIPEDAGAYAAYLAGDLDVVGVPAAVLRDVSSPGNPVNSQLRKMPDLATFGVFMNAAQAPFDNQKVREAFSMAIDREAFVQGVQQGAGVVTLSWIPPGMPGYSADAGKQWAFDPAKAKKALADAGFPEGRNLPKVTYTVTSTDSNRLVGQFLQDQLKKNLNVDIALDFVDSRTFGQRFTANQYSMATVTWIAGWPYPDNFLADLFTSDGNNNHVAYKDAKFDDLMKRAAAETDDKKRLANYDEAQKLLLNAAAIAPMYNRLSFVLVKPNVKDLTMTPIDGALRGDFNLAKVFIGQ